MISDFAVPRLSLEPPELRLANAGMRLGDVWLFRGIDIVIRRGEWLAILGPSGSGKTTLVRVLAGLVPLSAGESFVGGEPWHLLRGIERVMARRKLGYVQQQTGLLHTTALENVAAPLRWRGWSREGAARVARASLAAVDMADSASKDALELSGGERQRVAFARAIAGRPEILLLDEFTNNQDPEHEDLLESLVANRMREGASAILVAHDLVQVQRIRLHCARDPALGVLLEGRWITAGWASRPRLAERSDAVGSFLRRLAGPHPHEIDAGSGATEREHAAG